MPVTMLNGAHFTMTATWSNGRAINTNFHAIIETSTDRPTGIANAAARMNTAWITSVLPILPDNYSFTGCRWTDLATTSGATGTVGAGPQTGGDVSSAGTPPNVGILVTKNFAGAGRSKRTGRVFLPGNLESLVDENGIVAVGKLTQINTALNGFKVGVEGGTKPAGVTTLLLCVAHGESTLVTKTVTRRVADPNAELLGDPITSFTAQPLVSGIKRRVGR